MALIHSEGVLAGEMKHGTLALVDETMPILVVRSLRCQFVISPNPGACTAPCWPPFAPLFASNFHKCR